MHPYGVSRHFIGKPGITPRGFISVSRGVTPSQVPPSPLPPPPQVCPKNNEFTLLNVASPPPPALLVYSLFSPPPPSLNL